MNKFDGIIRREQQKNCVMRNEALFAFYLQAKINGQQERERLWRRLVVGCALLLVPGVYLLDNVSAIVDLYVGTIIRATVPMLYNGTMTLVVFVLAVGWLGHLISRR